MKPGVFRSKRRAGTFSFARRRVLALLPAYLVGGGGLYGLVFGPGSGARAATSEQSKPAPRSAAQGAVRFSVDAALATGNFIDGPAWIQISGTAVMNEPTPAEGRDGGVPVHGAQLNPRLTNTQGYDGRSTGFAPFDRALTHRAWPLAVSPGDVIVKIKSKIPGPERPRDGLPEQIAACFLVASPPPPNAFSPEVIGWPDRGAPAWHMADIATEVAALPSFPTGWHRAPSYAAIMARLDHYNPLYAQGAAQAPEFHSQMMANATVDGYNYGRHISVTIADGLKALISDRFSAAQKEAIAIRIVSMGLNWYGTFKRNGSYLDENGAILQFHFAAIALALAWTGRAAALPELGDPGQFAGNMGQALRLTEDDLASLAPHDSNTRPYPWRRRRVLEVYGRTVTVPELSPGEAGDPASNCVFDGMRLTREEDGASATVSTTAYDGDRYTLGLVSQPNPPFAAGDVVYCTVPGGVFPVAGDHDWCLSGRRHFSHYNPMPGAAYRNLNTWGGQLFCLRAMGIWDASWDTAFGYVKRANAPHVPGALYNHPTHNETEWDADMWRDYHGYVEGTATPPAAFESTAWSVADLATGGDVLITLTAMPPNGGTALTDVEYRVNDGPWLSSGMRAPGTFKVSGLTENMEAGVALRAVNLAGVSAASAGKAVTPGAGAVYFDLNIQATGTLWTDAAGTQAAGDGDPVRRIDDANGGSLAALAEDGAAILRRHESGKWYLDFQGRANRYAVAGWDISDTGQITIVTAERYPWAKPAHLRYEHTAATRRGMSLRLAQNASSKLVGQLRDMAAAAPGFAGYESRDAVTGDGVVVLAVDLAGRTQADRMPRFSRDGKDIRDIETGQWPQIVPAGFAPGGFVIGGGGTGEPMSGFLYSLRVHKMKLTAVQARAERALAAQRIPQ